MTPIRRLAARQHSLITRPQWIAFGRTDSQLRHELATGRLLRVVNGVYAVAGAPATWRQQVMAACLQAGPRAYAASATAAHLYGVSMARRPGKIEVLTEHGRSARSRLAIVHRTLELPRTDVATIDRIPVTRPARTLIDYAAVAPPTLLEEAVDDAIIRRLVTLERLQRRHEQLRGHGRAGCAELDRVLASWQDDMPQQVAEMRLLRRLMAWLDIRPVAQFAIYDEQGRFVARPDWSWPRFKVGYELKSFRWHGPPRYVLRDANRENRLRALGWTIFDALPAHLRGDGRDLAELVKPWLLTEPPPGLWLPDGRSVG